MAHGCSQRSNVKGRQGHQSADETDSQVEGTSISASTSASNTSEGAAHDPPAPHSIITPPTISALTTTRYHVRGPRETPEEIEEACQRELARRIAAADRIRQEQIVRGYEEGLRALRARIVALRREREAEVRKLRRKRERAWAAIERGEVAAVVVEDRLVGSDPHLEEAHGQIRSSEHYVPAETLLNGGDQQWQCPSGSAPCFSRSKSNFPAPPSQQQQLLQGQQQPRMGTFPLGLDAIGEDERGPRGTTHASRLPQNYLRFGQGRTRGSTSRPLPQPLRRRPAQMVTIPVSPHGSDILDPETCYGGTDGDNDSEMG